MVEPTIKCDASAACNVQPIEGQGAYDIRNSWLLPAVTAKPRALPGPAAQADFFLLVAALFYVFVLFL